ncbi:glycine zipper family protein [Cerasicoccus arenae]|nr:glycine zipper family protein [Cerasicoccus arenae]MBK1859088.1 hypothetical protein [Cerasicoccus arenae]
MKQLHFAVNIVVAIFASITLMADTLELRNGSSLKGNYEGGTPDVVRFNFNGSTQDYARGDIASLIFSKETPARPIETATSAPQPSTSSATSMTIPAGAVLVASIQSSLNSGQVKPGQTFPAILVSDLREGNQVLLPAGTQLQGQVINANSAGRFRKSAELSFTINAVTYQGQLIPVRASSQQEATEGGTGREMVGGAAKGAALGSIIGAITGDAGEGAAAGAAAGAAGGLIRKGDNVEYQAGSVLAFTLESPVNL